MTNLRSDKNNKFIFDSMHQDSKSTDGSMLFLYGGKLVCFDDLSDEEYANYLLWAVRSAASKKARAAIFKHIKNSVITDFFKSTYQWNSSLQDVITSIENIGGVSDEERLQAKEAITNAGVRWPSSYDLTNI